MKKGDKIQLKEDYALKENISDIQQIEHISFFSIYLLDNKGNESKIMLKDLTNNIAVIIPYMPFKKHLIKNRKGLMVAWLFQVFAVIASIISTVYYNDYNLLFIALAFIFIILGTFYKTYKNWEKNWKW